MGMLSWKIYERIRPEFLNLNGAAVTCIRTEHRASACYSEFSQTYPLADSRCKQKLQNYRFAVYYVFGKQVQNFHFASLLVNLLKI